MYRKVHTAGTPKSHKKGYAEKYQTSAHYDKEAEMNVFDATRVILICNISNYLSWVELVVLTVDY